MSDEAHRAMGADDTLEMQIQTAPTDVEGLKPLDEGAIIIRVADDVEMMRFCANGDIYVRGRLATNDLDVVDGVRALLKAASYRDSLAPDPTLPLFPDAK